MEKRLNTKKLGMAMEESGLNQASIATELGVSRESVSKWLNNSSFPRPAKLLALSKLLGLSFSELVVKEQSLEPQVAFRRVRATKTKDHHYTKAQSIGRLLRHLVPYLPFDTLEMPPVLKDPLNEYEYLQSVTKKVRRDVGVKEDEVIDFNHLIKRFRDLQTVLVPVLWGEKQRHENAIHIHLPDSKTTWVYLNLDVNIHDFKFWMAHELGHCMSPSLQGDEAEDFADAFAGALLFPRNAAEQAYGDVKKKRSKSKKLKTIMDIATEWVISPYSVYCELNKYANHESLSQFDLEPDIFKCTTRFNKNYNNVSETIFEDRSPSPSEYIEKSEVIFETPFFESLNAYIRDYEKGPGIVQSLLDASVLDARSIYQELT